MERMKKKKIIEGNAIIKTAVILILGLAMAVILEIPFSRQPQAGNPKIDAEKIKQLIMRGELSNHPAMYFEEIESEEKSR